MRGKSYSVDLREKVIQAVDNKKYTIQEIADIFKVSKRWIYKLIYQRRYTGSIAPLRHGGGREAKFQEESLRELKKLVNSQPDITLQEILDQTRVDASIMAVHRALKRLDFRRKKNHYGHQNRIVQT
jgi:transposase